MKGKPMQWVTLYCEACGDDHQAGSTQRLFHAKCVNRRSTRVVPQYVALEKLPENIKRKVRP
jgi:hypothetical protein